jgi:hypothetical protein
MLPRVVRLVVVGAAVLLALHLFMLTGHGHAGHGPMGPPGAVAHDAVAMDQQPHPTLDLAAALPALPAGVGMAATCFAVLAALLLLGAGVRHATPVRGGPAAAASSRPADHRPRPRARSPVELCVSRS